MARRLLESGTENKYVLKSGLQFGRREKNPEGKNSKKELQKLMEKTQGENLNFSAYSYVGLEEKIANL